MRSLEQRLARQPHAAPAAGAARINAKVVPSLGDKRTFSVLKSADADGTSADDFVSVTATVKHVGQKVVIYLDDASPTTGGYDQNDIDQIGSLFDDELYPIDTTAFGRESDVDGDGQVLVLLTDRVTRLAGCNNGQVVVGFFFALDLFEGEVGSNGAEVFYGLTPDPACSVDKARAVELLPGVFIHEFQHMISFNQHVLVRDGDAEDTWLNEGLSGYAEELGGAAGPRCALRQQRLPHPVRHRGLLQRLRLPGLAGGELPDRTRPRRRCRSRSTGAPGSSCAGWGTTSPAPSRWRPISPGSWSRPSSTGAANVEAATGEDFPTLITEFHLANYADDLPQFTPADDRITYTSWPFRAIWASFNQQNPGGFPRPYPLDPDVTSGGYETAGSLLAGSGKHVLIEQAPNDPALDFKITRSDGTTVLPASAAARVAVLRIR